MSHTDLPILTIPEVAHVGDLDPSKKRSGSYEGDCLSVSLVPTAWASIAGLGDNGYILRGRGRFVDALSLSPSQRQAVADWSVSEGLLEACEVIRIHMLDTEIDKWTYSDYANIEEAEEEAEWMEEGDFHYEAITTFVGTERLAKISGHSGCRMGSSLSFDMALIEYARRDPLIDGIWWNERLHPAALSAPRGGIFPERFHQLFVRSADWAELERFEASHKLREDDLDLCLVP
jgi:hypothetical protein